MLRDLRDYYVPWVGMQVGEQDCLSQVEMCSKVCSGNSGWRVVQLKEDRKLILQGSTSGPHTQLCEFSLQLLSSTSGVKPQ